MQTWFSELQQQFHVYVMIWCSSEKHIVSYIFLCWNGLLETRKSCLVQTQSMADASGEYMDSCHCFHKIKYKMLRWPHPSWFMEPQTLQSMVPQSKYRFINDEAWSIITKHLMRLVHLRFKCRPKVGLYLRTLCCMLTSFC